MFIVPSRESVQHCPQHFSICVFIANQRIEQAYDFLHSLLFVPETNHDQDGVSRRVMTSRREVAQYMLLDFMTGSAKFDRLASMRTMGHQVENMLFKIIIILQLIMLMLNLHTVYVKICSMFLPSNGYLYSICIIIFCM